MRGRDPSRGSGGAATAAAGSPRFVHERSERERSARRPSRSSDFRTGGYGFGGPGILGTFGTLTGAAGIIIIAVSALIGAVITVIMRRDPGNVLGVVVLIGTVLACLAVRARSVRLLIPVPTLSYVPAALIAGSINDRALDTTHTADALNAGSWIASGFLMMTLATIAALVFTGLRLFLDWRYHPQPRQYSRPRPVGDDWDAPRRTGPKPLDLDQTRPGAPVGRDQTRPIGAASATGPYAPQDTGPYAPQGTTVPPGTGPYPPQGTVPPGTGPYPPQGTAPRRTQDTGPRRTPDTGPRGPQDTGQQRPQGSGPYQAQDTGTYRPQDIGPYAPKDTGAYAPQDTGAYQARDRRPARREIAGPARPQGSGPQQAQDSGPYRSQGSGPYEAQDPYPSGPYPEPADLSSSAPVAVSAVAGRALRPRPHTPRPHTLGPHRHPRTGARLRTETM